MPRITEGGNINRLLSNPIGEGPEGYRVKTVAMHVVRNILGSYSLGFFGFALSKTYIALNKPFIGNGLIPNNVTFFLLMFSLMAVVLALFSLVVDPQRLQRPLLGVSCICLVCAPALMATEQYLLPCNVPVCVAIDVVSAVGCISLSALWVDCYSSFNPTLVAFFVAGSLVISKVLEYVLISNASPRRFVVLVLLALLSVASYSKASANAFPQNYPRLICKAFLPVRVCLFVALYSFAQGMLNTNSAGASIFDEIARTLPSCIVLLVIVFNAKKFSIRVPYGIAFSMMMIGLLVPALVPDATSCWREVTMNISYAALELMIPIMACAYAFNSGRSAVWAFCIFAALEMACRVLGGVLADILAAYPLGELLSGVLLLFLVLAILVIGVALLAERNLFARGTLVGKQSTESDDGLNALRASVNGLSARYSLTQRETEVLHLLAQGKTNGMIARDMMIADGTVKAHVQHIYQKLEVHSRKELRALIERG